MLETKNHVWTGHYRWAFKVAALIVGTGFVGVIAAVMLGVN